MATIDEIKKIRLKKLKAIKEAGFLAYPVEAKRDYTCEEAHKEFSKLSRSKKEIHLLGRIMSIREHGGLVFSNIKDGTAEIQTLLKKDGVGEKSYDFFLQNFDIGDFIQVKGILFKTKKGEETLDVSDYKILAKSLLPLPEKWHGIQDVEERYRRRYLDLIFNSPVKKNFELRSQIIREIRNFLEKEGFLAVETPILQPLYGGAKARPFKTHLNALDIDLYLRIAPELYLKRLLVGGFEKIYEIGKCFRNEGVDRSHNPDFTMLEFYWAYQNYKDLMKFTEKMLSEVIKKVFGKLKISYGGKEIDFTPPWPRIEFNEVFKKYTDIVLDEIHADALREKARALGVEPKGDKAETADEIYKKFCRPKIWQPTFIIHHPLGMFPLAKQLDKNPSKTANFQLVVADMELINAFSELNDPLEQRKRFEEQEKIFKEGFDEAQRIDEDFIEALEYGMPTAAGFGMGIDRLVSLLTDSNTLREVIFFPTMRPKGKNSKNNNDN
jgi:lysyl-tRNA synthetase class 2